MNDTIIALATAVGEASIHILRLSGSQSREVINKCFVPLHPERWERDNNFTLHLGKFYSGTRLLDEVLIGKMAKPTSFTGEEVFEINCHGGLLVAERIMQECLKHGVRLAEPGEFTKRAFLNGKLDLVQAEAIIDLISAKTNISADLALNQMTGNLSRKIFSLRDQVLETLAFIEAGIDFPEDDVESLDRNRLLMTINSGVDIAQELLSGSKTGKILREGMQTAIIGQPNVGKSSLLNALMQEERAIVTDIPGTTRDEIREAVNIGGVLLQLIDTAGIRESEDPVEKLGIERSWRAVKKSDLILLVIEADKELSTEELIILKENSNKVIVIINKIDKLDETSNLSIMNSDETAYGVWIPFSVKEGIGFFELEKEIKRRVYQGNLEITNEPLISSIRQISSLERALSSLQSAQLAVQEGLPWDIVSIDIRQALQVVSEITGDNIQESLLDDIFSRFCIGK
jgi:tRNA modification GTPase